MTDYLDELERVEREATRGPWLSYEGELMIGPTEHGYGPKIGSFNYDRKRFGVELPGWSSESASDASLAASARNALPRLIAELREARALLGQAKPTRLCSWVASVRHGLGHSQLVDPARGREGEGALVTLTPEQALKVARFCWPAERGNEWIVRPYGARLAHGEYKTFEPNAVEDLAAAERALVERGMGEEYGRALRHALLIEDAAKDRRGQYLTDGEIASVRTAPPEVIARAILRVVEEHG